MPTICHFEIPADDIEQVRKFYSKLFGWKIERDKGLMEYWRINTTPNAVGGISGGVERRQDPQHRITIWIDVPSVDEFAAKVETLGGRVFVPKTALPGRGYYAYCLDPEDNYFVIWEMDRNAK